MADVSAQSQSFHFGLCLCILILGLTTLAATYSPVTLSSDHLTMMLEKKVATLELLIRPLQ